MERKVAVLMVLAMVLSLAACGQGFIRPAYDAAGISKTSYDAAGISKTSYDVALTAMGNLHKQGFISDKVKDQAVKYGKAYKIAHNGMVEALAKYAESGGAANQQAYLAASTEASKTLLELLNYCTPFINGGK